MDNCIGCGKCCNKHWLLKLTSNSEIELFSDSVVFGSFIWTDECKYLIDNKCSIHENKPFKCKEYFCECEALTQLYKLETNCFTN